MKTYKSHKTVQAAKILSLLDQPDRDGVRLITGPGALDFVDVGASWIMKHANGAPWKLVGGYLVSYADAYISWSPAEAFEEGYTEHSLDPKDGALPVAGYKPQTDEKVATVNAFKQNEERTLRLIEDCTKAGLMDGRWVAIGKTMLEQGFMAINRAVFQPGRVTLPEDVSPKTFGAIADPDPVESAPGAASLINRDGFARQAEAFRADLEEGFAAAAVGCACGAPNNAWCTKPECLARQSS